MAGVLRPQPAGGLAFTVPSWSIPWSAAFLLSQSKCFTDKQGRVRLTEGGKGPFLPAPEVLRWGFPGKSHISGRFLPPHGPIRTGASFQFFLLSASFFGRRGGGPLPLLFPPEDGSWTHSRGARRPRSVSKRGRPAHEPLSPRPSPVPPEPGSGSLGSAPTDGSPPPRASGSHTASCPRTHTSAHARVHTRTHPLTTAQGTLSHTGAQVCPVHSHVSTRSRTCARTHTLASLHAHTRAHSRTHTPSTPVFCFPARCAVVRTWGRAASGCAVGRNKAAPDAHGPRGDSAHTHTLSHSHAHTHTHTHSTQSSRCPFSPPGKKRSIRGACTALCARRPVVGWGPGPSWGLCCHDAPGGGGRGAVRRVPVPLRAGVGCTRRRTEAPCQGHCSVLLRQSS